MFLDGPLAPVPTKSSVLFTASVQPISTAPRPSGSMTFYDNGVKIATRPLTPTSSGGAMAQLTIAWRLGRRADRGGCPAPVSAQPRQMTPPPDYARSSTPRRRSRSG
jgi:hypothetical protein